MSRGFRPDNLGRGRKRAFGFRKVQSQVESLTNLHPSGIAKADASFTDIQDFVQIHQRADRTSVHTGDGRRMDFLPNAAAAVASNQALLRDGLIRLSPSGLHIGDSGYILL